MTKKRKGRTFTNEFKAGGGAGRRGERQDGGGRGAWSGGGLRTCDW